MESLPASIRNSKERGIHLNQKRDKNESKHPLKHFRLLFGAFCSLCLTEISLHLNHQPLYVKNNTDKKMRKEILFLTALASCLSSFGQTFEKTAQGGKFQTAQPTLNGR